MVVGKIFYILTDKWISACLSRKDILWLGNIILQYNIQYNLV